MSQGRRANEIWRFEYVFSLYPIQPVPLICSQMAGCTLTMTGWSHGRTSTLKLRLADVDGRGVCGIPLAMRHEGDFVPLLISFMYHVQDVVTLCQVLGV